MSLADERDLEATARQLVAWLRDRFPAAARVSVSELTPPGNGFSNETLLFDFHRTEGGREHIEPLVVRTPPDFPVFPTYDLERQYRVMELLAAHGIPVPRMRWFEKDPSVLGKSFYVMDRVEGVIPPDLPPYHAQGFCTEIGPARRAAIWWSGLETLARIHALDWKAAGFEFLDAPEWGAGPLDQQLGYYAQFLEWAAQGRPQPTCEAALAWLRANQPSGEPVVLCWGDSRLPNMIFRDDRCVSVLDWEMATLGSPEQDLGWWIFMDWHHSTGIDVPRLEGFPTREETVSRYEELSGRRVRHLDYYEVFAAFRFGVIMIRVAHELEARGLPAPSPAFERDNPCTRALARLLEIPAPGVFATPRSGLT